MWNTPQKSLKLTQALCFINYKVDEAKIFMESVIMSSTQVLAVMNAMNIFGYIKTVCTADGIKTVLVERETPVVC